MATQLLTPIEAAALAHQQAHAATEAARTAAYALEWGAPGEDEAWQALERCQAVEKARHTDWLAAIDTARDAAVHTPIVSEDRPPLIISAESLSEVSR